MKLIFAEAMKKMEEAAFSEYGFPSALLMENAAHGFFNALKKHIKNFADKKALVFCGKGNNGGDGFAIARYLKNAGADTKIVLLADIDDIRGDAKINLDIAKNMDIPIITDIEKLQSPDIIIDAIFGIGFRGELSGIYKEATHFINKADAFVASVDVPSGADCDCGLVSDGCVKADITVTFSYLKAGMVLYPLKRFCGKIYVCDICIPKALESRFLSGGTLLDDKILKKIPKRREDAHKGSFGRLLCICGSSSMTGAAFLSATAAVKSGAGMVSVASQKAASCVLAKKLNEAMTITLDGDLKADAPALLAYDADVLLLGCGIGREKQTKELAIKIIREAKTPMVIDADGLFALSENIEILKERKAETILTPHLKEFARLLGISVGDVINNKISLAREFAKEYGVYLILKSAETIIAIPDGEFYICSRANSGLSKGGSGDVLAGICASFLAQTKDAKTSSVLSVYVHSKSAELAKAKLGEYFMSATDIIKYLPKVLG